ncbi:MAG: aminomethyl transferase family protein, partial [Acidobacteria bacterium]|nr:aminomethyl transferase family protein [Acidobacteriota bacterium]
LSEAGRAFGLIPAGIGIYLTTARLEKGYRLQGADLDIEYDAHESGVARPRTKRHDFIGRAAYLEAREHPPAAILCTLTVDDHRSSDGIDRYMTGREPILGLDGEPLVDAKGRRSYVTSAGEGPSVGKFILMGYLPSEHAVAGEKLLVEYFGERYPVTVEIAGNAVCLDMSDIKMRYMRGMIVSLEEDIQTPGTDEKVSQYLSELGLQLSQEAKHGLLTGVES